MFLPVLLCLCFWRLDGAVPESVFEGDSVSLKSRLTEIKDDDVIQWRFGYDKSILIAEINKRAGRFTVYDDVLDGRFRDRLKLDNQTGSLTITNTTTEHEGDYKLQINSAIRESFYLNVYGLKSVFEGDSVSINSNLTEIKDDDVILWRFEDGNTLIAEINKRADRFTVYDDVLDGRFRDRLKLDNQTGSLTITNTTTEDTGVYRLLTNSEIKLFILDVFDEMESVSVMEGDSVSLNSNLTEIKRDDVILWRFEDGKTLMAEINKRADRFTVYDDLDGRFRDRLKLDNQTGSLTISHTTTDHAGDYRLQKFSGRFSSKLFRVSVYNSAHCCGPTEAVIRLVLSALVGVATVIILVYDIRSRRAERDQAHIHTSAYKTGGMPHSKKTEMSFSSLYSTEQLHISTSVILSVLKSLSFHICGLKLMKMFLPVLLCLCFWRLDGGFAVEFVSVFEGDSFSINSDLTEIKDDDVIQWRFGNTLIAEINKRADRFTVYDDVLDGRFRDRLKLDKQTGSLTITNITTKHEGEYELQISSVIRESFSLNVYRLKSVMEGDSVSLNSDTEIKDDDEIQWKFGDEDTLIAKINKQFDIITVYDVVLDGRFRNRLKLDKQTGSLTITNATTEHEGRYRLLMSSGGRLSSKVFRVSVYNSVHCCGPTEAVIRLVLSALVGVATVIILVYDIRSRRAE
ncbi:hypothetical protein F2P79_013758 [Pimephales promelas]|nr:hypothetical protein F2P79_013758 [Pimephales promelas]